MNLGLLTNRVGMIQWAVTAAQAGCCAQRFAHVCTGARHGILQRHFLRQARRNP